MLATSKEEVEKVLLEAEQIKAGENPATVTAQESVASGPATGPDRQGETGAAPAPVPSPSMEQLAELACLLCDWPFVRAFGQTAQLSEPFRGQARQAWIEVLEKYLPAIIEKSGPFGVLFSIYSLHGAGLYLSCQINAPAAPSSGSEAAAKAPS